MPEEVPGLTCNCGAENFVRVVLKRPMRARHVTDFVACANCAAVYYVPAWDHGDGAMKRDVTEASKDYRKPGRR